MLHGTTTTAAAADFVAFHGSVKGMRLKCEDEWAGKLAKTLDRDWLKFHFESRIP